MKMTKQFAASRDGTAPNFGGAKDVFPSGPQPNTVVIPVSDHTSTPCNNVRATPSGSSTHGLVAARLRAALVMQLTDYHSAAVFPTIPRTRRLGPVMVRHALI
jgi:hypothetical protein